MNDAPSPPPVALGYLFALAFLVYEFATLNQPDEWIIAITIVVAAWTYYLWNVYIIHKMTQAKIDAQYFISPSKAVWSHFIPIYNAYWLYKWPHELFETLQSKFGELPFASRAVHVCMGGGLLLARFDFAFGFALFWTGVVIVIRGLNQLDDVATVLPTQGQVVPETFTWSADLRDQLRIPDHKRRR